jgi:phage terminase large subunit
MTDFVYTTAIRKIRSMTKRKKVIQGGTSAGKTFGILPVLIDRAARTDGLEISVVSESVPHLRRGAMKDFLKVMNITGRYNDGAWNRSLLTYTFGNGSYIEFFSADQEARLRGARRHILYVNEANNIPFESYYQLAIRTSDEILIDFNPTMQFWAHTEVLQEDDSEHLILTFKDNEALPDTIRKDIEKAEHKAKDSAYWHNWWQVYGLGKIGSLQGVVFDGWNQCDKLPDDYRWRCIGLDWGYTNDPTAIVEIRQADGKLWMHEIHYATGMSNKDISNVLDGFKGIEIIADSSEPKSIDELRRYGHRNPWSSQRQRFHHVWHQPDAAGANDGDIIINQSNQGTAWICMADRQNRCIIECSCGPSQPCD